MPQINRKNQKFQSENNTAYMLDEQFISDFAHDHRMERAVAKKLIEAVFECAKHSLLKNSILRIRGFGTFTIKTRKKCKFKNNYTGQEEEVSMVKVIGFAPARGMKDTLNGKTKDELFRHAKKLEKQKKEMDYHIITHNFRD